MNSRYAIELADPSNRCCSERSAKRNNNKSRRGHSSRHQSHGPLSSDILLFLHLPSKATNHTMKPLAKVIKPTPVQASHGRAFRVLSLPLPFYSAVCGSFTVSRPPTILFLHPPPAAVGGSVIAITVVACYEMVKDKLIASHGVPVPPAALGGTLQPVCLNKCLKYLYCAKFPFCNTVYTQNKAAQPTPTITTLSRRTWPPPPLSRHDKQEQLQIDFSGSSSKAAEIIRH